MDASACSPEVNRQGLETDHSPTCTTEFANEWCYTSVTTQAFMVCTGQMELKVHSLIPLAFTGSACRMATKQVKKTHTDSRSYFQQFSAITTANLTNYIQRNPCSWSDSLSASQDIHCLLWNPEDLCRVNRAHASKLWCYASANKWLQHCSCLCQLLGSVLWVVYIKRKQVHMRCGALRIYVHLLRSGRERFVWEVDIRSSYIWVSVVNVLINIVLCHSLMLVLN